MPSGPAPGKGGDMPTISVPGREDLRPPADASAGIGVTTTVKRAVRVDSVRAGGREVQVPLEDDDVVEVTLEGGVTVWVKPDELESRFGFSASRSDGVIRLAPHVEVDEPSRGPVRWAIEGLAVLGIDVTGGTAAKVAEAFEKRTEPGLRRWTEAGALEPIEADRPLRTGEPSLLFLHGTASSTSGSFDGLRSRQPTVWAALRRGYGDRILGFEHASLSESPVRNACRLLEALPDGANLHIVSHSRGGLVGELIGRSKLRDAAGGARPAFSTAELDRCRDEQRPGDTLHQELVELNDLIARKRVTVSRFVRVACPARGTVLIDGRADRWLTLLFNVMRVGAGGIGAGAEAVEALQDLVLATVKQRSNAAVLPGLAAMVPGQSPLLQILNQPTVVQDDELVVIAGDCDAGGVLRRIGLWFADLYFGADHDLVVDTASMDGGAPRPVRRVELDRSADVSHFNYFANARTARIVADALANPDAFNRKSETPEAEEARSRTRPLRSRSRGRPLVYVLPGISGSHLKRDARRIWINPLELAQGGVLRLGIDAVGITPEAPIDRYYGELCDFLRKTHDVAPLAYDWRKPIAGVAQGFARELAGMLRGSQPVRIVAHSMGGLVARTAFLQNRDLWNAFRGRDGSRLLMLGTPNGGSYSIPLMLLGRNTLMQWLHRLDFTATAAEHLEIAAGWDGALQMLPRDAPDLLTTKWWDNLPRGDLAPGFGAGPNATDLREAAHFIEAFADAPLDPACMAYIAGQADTYDAVEIDGPDGARRIRFRVTPEGDGAVLWKLGIPRDGNGRPKLPTWYTRIEHGDLARRPAIFPAILDILLTGRTDRLDTSPPSDLRLSRSTLRAAEAAGDAPPDGPVYIHTEPIGLEQVPDPILAHASSGSATKGEPARQQPVTIRVLHSDLRHATYPVLVGHYANDTIAGTERILDTAQRGRIERRRRRGLHPGRVGTFDIHLPADDQGPSSLIVGLGPVTELTRGELVRAIRTGLIGLGDALEERRDEMPASGRGVSTVLVGSGGGVVSPSDCIVALLTAVREANAALEGEAFTTLEIVEIDEQRAINAWHILRRILDNNVSAEAFLLDGTVARGRGGWHRVGPDESERDWYITVKVEGKTVPTDDGPEDILAYEVVGGYARVAAELVGVQRMFVRELVERIAGSRGNEGKYPAGRTLFEALWPAALKDHSLDDRSMRLVLDETAAALPWEMLDDRRADLPPTALDRVMPPAARFKLVRQLVSAQPARLRRRSGDGRRALVIGDPRDERPGSTGDGPFPRLDGALREAERVRDRLRTGGYEVEFLGRDASALDVQSAILAAPWDIIHVAAHGVVDYEIEEPDDKAANGKRPQKVTGIVLGGESPRIIGASFFESLRTAPDLVFLNCCLLGGIKAEKPLRQGRPRLASSLAAALIRGGVPTVVAAGWEVDDGAAAVFADTFFRRMLEGGNFGTAAFEARRETYSHDRTVSTWGAYQCYGDPDFRLPESYGRSGNGSKPVYAAPSEAISQLERIVATADVSPCGAPDLEWLEQVETAIGQHGWGGRGDVQAALGEANRALGRAPEAICCYEAAARAEEGPVPIRSIEARLELMAHRDAGLGDLGKVDDAIDSLEALTRLCGETWARHTLVARCRQHAALRTSGADRDAAIGRIGEALAKAAEVGARRTPPLDPPSRGRLLALRLVQALREKPMAGTKAQERAALTKARSVAREFRRKLPGSGWLQAEAVLLELIADGDIGEDDVARIAGSLQRGHRARQAAIICDLARLFEDLLNDLEAFGPLCTQLAEMRARLGEA